MKTMSFSIVNTSPTPVSIASFSCDPLQSGDSGTVIPSSFGPRLADPKADSTIWPGEHLMFELTGEAPARPGTYATVARIRTNKGEGLAIPVTLEVPASPLWGIGCMVLGLVALGVINVLAGEGAVNTQLHDALAARQQIHTWLEANPAPQAKAGDIEAMDRDYEAAVVALGERRHVSFLDHRAAEAAEHLKAANAAADQLRHDLGGRPRGAAEIDDLARDWKDLQATLQQIAAFPTGPASNPSPGLVGKLDAFLVRYRIRFLQPPMGWISDEMTSDLDRIRLAYAAGEGEQARDLALTTRLWLRRSSRALNTALVGYRGALVLSGSMVNADTAIRARLARGDIPAAARTTILAMLDTASTKMDGEAWLPEWADAHHQINLAKTELVRATTETIKARFNGIIAETNTQTDTGDIDALIETLQASPDHSLAAKQAGLNRVLDLWRRHVDGVTDPATKKQFQNQIDALSALIAKGDLTGTGPLYRTLGENWVAWNTRLIREAGNRLDHQHCLDTFTDLQHDSGAIEASLRERPPGPELERWDRELDQLRLDMQREGPDAETVSDDCMGPLLGLGRRALALSGEILTANITDLDVPALTRARLGRSSGLTEAIAATEANLDRARPLDLTLVTPAADLVVGRTVTFTVGRMDPVWGSGVRVGVTFGDGSPPFVATAEDLRQGHQITHEYGTPLSAHLSVTAAKDFKPGGTEPVAAALGSGDTTILISPSPVTRAQRLADDFLNLRFAIALLIALVVYYWRYQSKTAVFGQRGFDYVEAFTLGFAANAAVEKLPEILAKLVPVSS